MKTTDAFTPPSTVQRPARPSEGARRATGGGLAGGAGDGIGWGLACYCPGTTWVAAGEGRMDAVFALLGGFAGTALFAQLHETLIPLLYDPTNVGQITLTGFLGNYAVAVAVLAVGFGVCTWTIGKLCASGDRVVAFERGPDPGGSSN